MDSTKFQDDLWEEIPDYAYIALGRRGREKIMLHECFVHGCGVKDETLLHILQKTETIEKNVQQLLDDINTSLAQEKNNG